jgi:hypothetical protein
MGASQSVKTERMLASTKAICRSAFFSCAITVGNIEIFFVAGCLKSKQYVYKNVIDYLWVQLKRYNNL